MRRFIISIIFIFFFSKAHTQDYLGFGYNGVLHEDTLHIGDSIHFSFWIVNQGVNSFNDSIFINCSTYDNNSGLILSMPIGSVYNISDSILSNDSIYITITSLVSLQSFSLGDNIVVIWPASVSPANVDTSITSVHILGSSNDINELNISQPLIFPNPVSQNLYIENIEGIYSIHITTLLGEVLINKNNLNTNFFKIDVSSLSPGSYFLNLRNGKGEFVVRKIIVN